MNIDRLTPPMLARALTSALLVLAMAGPSSAGADIVPNRPCAASMNSATCKPGLVWRLARPEDLVCVHPDWRTRAAIDNTDAPNNVGADGPDSCRVDSAGERLVWRNAFPGDRVCVTREVMTMTRSQNRDAAQNRACS